MANEVVTKWASVYDADRRPIAKSSLDELENVGVTFNAYGLKEGQVITIDENPEVIKQAPRREGQRPTYLVACKRDGVNSWFNPNALLGIDADLQPIYPKWAALGGAKAVITKIQSMKGGIKGGKPFDVKQTKFNRDGSIKEVALKKPNGDLELNEDNTPKMVRDTEMRPYVSVTDPTA